jgi:rRNA pseudouridine-1189 N-methylase Emg1 (Nep1/Mra1 family)
MQQSGKRLSILLTKEEIAAIDDFRFENRMRKRSDAVHALLKLALDQIGEDPAKSP